MPAESGLVSWGESFLSTYEKHRALNREKKEHNRRRAAQRLRIGNEPDNVNHDLLDLLARQRESKKSLVDLRANRGYMWIGGAIGGSRDCYRTPFIYKGLVSNEHAVLKLFVTKLPRARRLMSGDNKAEAISTDSKLLALDSAYIESNKKMRGVLRVELDSNWSSWQALEREIVNQGVMLPNVCVGHEKENGEVIRPHLIWMLADSVAFTERGHKKTKQAWNNASRALVAALLPLGADPGGISNAHRHKNPLSPLWSRIVMAHEPYSLTKDQRLDAPGYRVLKDSLPDLMATRKLLANHVESFESHGFMADHPNTKVASQSNILWRELQKITRKLVKIHRDGRGSRQGYDTALANHALNLCCKKNERKLVLKLADKMGDWMWKNGYASKAKGPRTQEEVVRSRRSGHKNACASKKSSTLQSLIDAAHKLVSEGVKVTQKNTAEMANRCRRTTQMNWEQVLKSLEKGVEKSAFETSKDKKDFFPSALPQLSIACRYPNTGKSRRFTRNTVNRVPGSVLLPSNPDSRVVKPVYGLPGYVPRTKPLVFINPKNFGIYRTLPVSSNPEALSGNPIHSTGNPELFIGNLTHSTGNPELFIGNLTHSTRNPELSSVNQTHSLGNPEALSGNQTNSIGNLDLLSGNQELFIGNPIHSTSNPEYLSGNPTHSTGNPDLLSGNPTHSTGNPDLLSGNQTHYIGNPDLLSGSQTHSTGSPDLLSGNPTHFTSNQELISGNQMSYIGNLTHSIGNQELTSGISHFSAVNPKPLPSKVYCPFTRTMGIQRKSKVSRTSTKINKHLFK